MKDNKLQIDINSHTRLCCIFGNPVKHSLSPVMQNAAFRSCSIDVVYLAFEVNDIKDAVSAMRSLNIIGASVTIPFKREIMKFLDHIDPLADMIGSVNTLKNNNNRIVGYNTDGQGALSSLIEKGIPVRDSKILILGNGGSARAIAFTLLKEDAKIIIAGRNAERVSALVDDLKRGSANVGSLLIKDISLDFMKGIDVIINTTPIGMTPKEDYSPLDEKLILKDHTIFDIVYSPNTTKLLQIGKSKGCKIIHGIDMLIYQGVKQYEIWTGQRAPFDVMKKSIEEYISEI